MATFRMTLDSSWALSDLFNYMATFSNAADWDPSATSGEELTGGEPRLHSEYRLSVALGSREVPLVYEIIEFDRLRRVVLSAEYKMLRSLAEIDVTPSQTGTLLTYAASVTGPGLLEPLIARALRRNGTKTEASLRAKIDA
jgi:hypothetical protein